MQDLPVGSVSRYRDPGMRYPIEDAVRAVFLLHPEREDAGRDLHVRQNIQSLQRPSMKQITFIHYGKSTC